MFLSEILKPSTILDEIHKLHPTKPHVPCNFTPHRPHYSLYSCITIIYHTIPYRTVPYRTVPYRTVPYRTVPYRTVPYRTVPYHTIPYHTIPYHTILYHVTNPQTTSSTPHYTSHSGFSNN